MPVDVIGTSLGVGPMLCTVVLDADLPLLITHVNSGERIAEVVVDHDLRLRAWQGGVDKH